MGGCHLPPPSRARARPLRLSVRTPIAQRFAHLARVLVPVAHPCDVSRHYAARCAYASHALCTLFGSAAGMQAHSLGEQQAAQPRHVRDAHTRAQSTGPRPRGPRFMRIGSSRIAPRTPRPRSPRPRSLARTVHLPPLCCSVPPCPMLQSPVPPWATGPQAHYQPLANWLLGQRPLGHIAHEGTSSGGLATDGRLCRRRKGVQLWAADKWASGSSALSSVARSSSVVG